MTNAVPALYNKAVKNGSRVNNKNIETNASPISWTNSAMHKKIAGILQYRFDLK